jgi:hypothetical protein
MTLPNLKNLVFSWPSSLLVGLVILCFFTTGCANIQPPLGGPRDSLPPVLLKATPDENSINFTGNTIRFQFNEYVKLDNLNDNLIINPPAERFPNILSKLRTVTVKLKDTLQPNTTYTINFGNAVRDVNENNPLRGFSYSFSTGAYIDSLDLTGKIYDAQTGKPDSTLLIILHKNSDDSTVAKEKPRFATRANGQGQFTFDHLPEGEFYIYALKDEGMKKYTSNSIPFAFFDRKVSAGEQDSIELRFFVGEKEEERKKASSTASKPKSKDEKEDKKLKYTVSAQSGQDLLEPLTIAFAKPTANIDSSKIRLTDTLEAPIAITSFERDTLGMSIKLFSAWKENFHYQLFLDKGFAEDSAGVTTLRPDTVIFKSKAETEYAQVKVKFTGVDLTKHPVLQWIEGDKVVLSAALTGNEYNVKLFKPGQYKLRILFDANQNGIWDTGNYWEKRQPEFVTSVDQTFSIKANWENEFEVNL